MSHPILMQLHWLPVYYRCMFKTATLVYKYLHSDLPSNFGPYLSPCSSSYNARRSQPKHHYVKVPPFCPSLETSKQFGHSFAFDAPKVWNDLSDEVRGASSLAIFRRKLNTYLFTKAYPP